MATRSGWYLLGPLSAVGLVGFLSIVFWRLGLQWTVERDPHDLRDPYAEGLGIFADPDDYGLLVPAAVTPDPDVADEIRGLLGDAGIRATHAVRRDGCTAVLVFTDQLAEARRLVGDSPAL